MQRVGIIGGGVAGLVTAKILGRAGFECEIFERSPRLGGVWAVGYHSYGLQTPRSFYEFPDWPMPAHYPEFPSGEQICAYVEGYARHFGLEAHLEHDVQRLTRAPDGPGWLIDYTDRRAEATRQRHFDRVVVATGLYSDPFVPDLPGRDGFRGEVLHSSAYQVPAQVEGREVIVVGFGKSALDIAIDASKHAERVTLLFRDAHWPVPTKVLGLVDVRKLFMNRLASGFLPLYQRPEPWEARLHRHAPWLVSGLWRAVEATVRLQFRLDACDAVPRTPFERDLFTGGVLPTDDTYPRLRSGAVQPRRGQIGRYLPDGVELADGTSVRADTVIFGTGWKCDHRMLPASFRAGVEADGVYLYRHILHPALLDLGFVGWASTNSNALTSHLAARWLREHWTGRMAVPPAAEMRREVEAMKAWKRGFMPPLSCRGSMLQLHMWHFHDELLRDMGLNPRRKRHALAELLADYSPADYAALFD